MAHGAARSDRHGGITVVGQLQDIGRWRGSTGLTLLSAIVDSSDDAIVGKTVDGLITSWNTGAQRMYGYTADEVLGQPIKILSPADRIDETTEILSKIRRGERVLHLETVRQRKDGTTLPVSVTVSPVRDEEGTLIGVSSIARDNTEQHRCRGRTSSPRGRARASQPESGGVLLLGRPRPARPAASAGRLQRGPAGGVLGHPRRGRPGLRQANPGRQRADGHADRRPIASFAGLAGRDSPPRRSTSAPRSTALPRNSSARSRTVASASSFSAQSGPWRTACLSAPYCRTCWATPGSSPPAGMRRRSNSGRLRSGPGTLVSATTCATMAPASTPAYAEQAVQAIPAAASEARVPRHWRRPRQRAAHRGETRRSHLGRGRGRPRFDLLFHA